MNSARALLVFFGAGFVASVGGGRLLLKEADLPCFFARVCDDHTVSQDSSCGNEPTYTRLVIYEIDLDLAAAQKSAVEPFLRPLRLVVGLVPDKRESTFRYKLDIGQGSVRKLRWLGQMSLESRELDRVW